MGVHFLFFFKVLFADFLICISSGRLLRALLSECSTYASNHVSPSQLSSFFSSSCWLSVFSQWADIMNSAHEAILDTMQPMLLNIGRCANSCFAMALCMRANPAPLLEELHTYRRGKSGMHSFFSLLFSFTRRRPLNMAQTNQLPHAGEHLFVVATRVHKCVSPLPVHTTLQQYGRAQLAGARPSCDGERHARAQRSAARPHGKGYAGALAVRCSSGMDGGSSLVTLPLSFRFGLRM